MNYWVISDTHFGHEKMHEYCGRPQGYESKILDHIKRCWQPNDVLIHLGDICFGNDATWLFKLHLHKTISKKCWLLTGNHDKKSYAFYIDKFFDFAGEFIFLNIYGKKILFSHMPQVDIGYDINVHGHFHNSNHRTNDPAFNDIMSPKHFLVAMEYNHYVPYNLRDIVNKSMVRQRRIAEKHKYDGVKNEEENRNDRS